MTKPQNLPTTSLNPYDMEEIENKINFELNEMQLKMMKVGGFTNIIGGILVLWIFYGQIQSSLLLSWYGILVFVNLIVISFSFYFQFCKVTPEKIKPWLRIYHSLILPMVCLIWGVMGVIFMTGDLIHRVYIIALLLAVLVSFCIGTITDFTACIISVCGLLLPTIFFHFYTGATFLINTGHDPGLNLALGVCLYILGTFLLIACYIGYILIKKSIKLTHINIVLNKELENMNQFLEQRVKERTIELEDSLEVVTYQATHDLLTDLPNQRLLLDYIDLAIKNSSQQKYMFGVVLFSINEIEKINDGLGHQAGDLVIKKIAERFKKKFYQSNNSNTRYTITLSRKDVFIILVEPMLNLIESENNSRQLFSVLDESVYIERQHIKLTASLGISLYPRDGMDARSLIMNASAAMLNAKKLGGNSLNIYSSADSVDISKQLELESNLHSAIENNELILHYQPVIDLKTGYLCCVEALIRWKHPALGLIYPDRFIPIAEANGVIIPLGEWVFRAACFQLKLWHDKGISELKMAINLSSKQLQKTKFDQVAHEILKQTHLDPKYIELELTESAAFQNDTIPILKQFKKLGLGLAIDDFGTGYSGLSNLKLFTIDKLKIDKSFVRDLMTNEDSKAIVTNTIALAKKMHVEVLAEGIETKEQLSFLQEQGCDLGQGYYFSPPVSADILFEQFLLHPKKLI